MCKFKVCFCCCTLVACKLLASAIEDSTQTKTRSVQMACNFMMSPKFMSPTTKHTYNITYKHFQNDHSVFTIYIRLYVWNNVMCVHEIPFHPKVLKIVSNLSLWIWFGKVKLKKKQQLS